KSIKHEKKKIKLDNGELKYDILVIGLGFEAETFGIPGLAEYAFTIEHINSARLIREHLAYNFAMYQHEDGKNLGRLNLVIGGGGLTGVEFLCELVNPIPELCEEYDINKSVVRVTNMEGEASVFPRCDPQLGQYAMNSRESGGVEFISGAMLKACKPDRIVFEKAGKE